MIVLTFSDGIVTVPTLLVPVIAVTLTVRPLTRPSVVASSRAMTVRSAPVSMMNANGPAPPIVTGTVMR